jgi:hypothetical protein
VDGLLVHQRDNDLIAATHGRAFWILDDFHRWRRSRPSAPHPVTECCREAWAHLQ